MKKEEFVALGIDATLAEKAAAESQKELEGFIPKNRFEEAETAKKQLETTIEDYKKQMETLKTSTGDVETLKSQITQLQEDNKKKDEEYQAKLKDMQLTNAVKLAIGDKAHDSEIVSGLIDKTKLILGEDGKVTGLEEQIKSLKEGKSFLFKEETPFKPQPGFRVGAFPAQNKNTNNDTKLSMKDAIAAKLQAQIAQPKE